MKSSKTIKNIKKDNKKKENICRICKKNQAVINGLCIECYIEKNKIIRKTKAIEIKYCIKCGKIKFRNKNYKNIKEFTKKLITEIKNLIILNPSYKIKKIIFDYNLEEALKFFITNKETNLAIDFYIIIKKIDEEIKPNQKHEKNQKQNKEEKTKVGTTEERKSELKTSIEIPLRIKYYVCETCNRKLGQYYEAIIQLRELNRNNIAKKTFDEIEKFIENESKKNEIQITNKKNLSNGQIDFYIYSNKFAQDLIKRINKQFNVAIKESKTLHTINWENSKMVFRYTYLVNVLGIEKNDYIIYNNKLYKFLGKLEFISVQNNKKIKLGLEELKHAKVAEKTKAIALDENTIMTLNDYHQYASNKKIDKEKLEKHQEFYTVIFNNLAYLIEEE